MTIDWPWLSKTATELAANLGVGLLLAFAGLRLYFRQKEYELVKQRYLDQCLDIVLAELDETAGAFLHNWSRCIEIVREFRDSPENFDKDHLVEGFLPFRGTRLNQTAHHRLKVLTGSDVFWRLYQLALSRHTWMNAAVSREIPQAISEYLAGRMKVNRDTIVEAAVAELKPMTPKSDRFAMLQNALLRIAAELEKSRLSFDEIGAFSNRTEIKKIVAEMNKYYADDLKSGSDAL